MFPSWATGWVVTLLTGVVVLEKGKTLAGREKDFVHDLDKIDLKTGCVQKGQDT